VPSLSSRSSVAKAREAPSKCIARAFERQSRVARSVAYPGALRAPQIGMLDINASNDNLETINEQDLETIEGGSWLDLALLVLVCVVESNVCA